MSMDCITFRSITPAQRAQRVLRRGGMEAALQRTPRQMEVQGCGYCLRIRTVDREMAVSLLEQANIPFGKIYHLDNRERAEP